MFTGERARPPTFYCTDAFFEQYEAEGVRGNAPSDSSDEGEEEARVPYQLPSTSPPQEMLDAVVAELDSKDSDSSGGFSWAGPDSERLAVKHASGVFLDRWWGKRAHRSWSKQADAQLVEAVAARARALHQIAALQQQIEVLQRFTYSDV